MNTCRVPSGVTAAQVVLVDSSGSAAAVRACRRTGSGYTTDLGPYYGHVGRNGVTASKREGDMSTPAGVFPLRGGFGVYGNPGLGVGSWLRVDAADVWVDDPSSSLYNTHQRTPAGGRWASAEELYNQPAYNYAQIVGYNEARTPGLGSAIFFHVDKGAGTAGCISLPDAVAARRVALGAFRGGHGHPLSPGAVALRRVNRQSGRHDVKTVAMLTAGGLAPCLSSAVGGLIERYTEVAPDVRIIAYRNGYAGLLTGDSVEVTDDVRARRTCCTASVAAPSATAG